jgi:Tfp pilus assembly protein PilV
VISVALLASASFALTKLARSAAELSQQSDQRLTAVLTAENTLERLRGVPAEQLARRSDEVAEQMTLASGCQVEVTTASFPQGVHVRVDVSPSANSRVTLHDWRLAQPAGAGASDDSGSSEENDG